VTAKRLLLVAWGVLLLALTAGPAHATTFPGQNGRIAFVSAACSSCAPEIYTMLPNGTSRLQITFDPGVEAAPAWSPDGTKLAFVRRPDFASSQGDLIVANADGSAPATVATQVFERFSWAPDGRAIAFARRVGSPPNGEIFRVNSDGTNETRLTNDPRDDLYPVWAPDGSKIVWIKYVDPAEFSGFRDVGFIMNSDGTDQTFIELRESFNEGGQHLLPSAWAPGPRPVVASETEFRNVDTRPGTDLGWAPDEARLGFISTFFSSSAPPRVDIGTMAPDGSDRFSVTSDPEVIEQDLEWSPDSRKFAFARRVSGSNFDRDIYTINADGTGIARLTDTPDAETQPDWQPVPGPSMPGYPRPQAGAQFRVPLAIAYQDCTSPNRTHGPPLTAPSCNPAQQQSDRLTVGTRDANTFDPQSVGFVKLTVCPIGTTANACSTPAGMTFTDVRMEVSMTDVRCTSSGTPCEAEAGPLPDYTGELQAVATLRITDRHNSTTAGGTGDPATTTDVAFPVTVPCQPNGLDGTGSGIGSDCRVLTSANAVVANSVRFGKRANWEIAQIHVFDGGPDGIAATGGNTVFARQGIFVP
jgi:Tol biopolymer transport system component